MKHLKLLGSLDERVLPSDWLAILIVISSSFLILLLQMGDLMSFLLDEGRVVENELVDSDSHHPEPGGERAVDKAHYLVDRDLSRHLVHHLDLLALVLNGSHLLHIEDPDALIHGVVVDQSIRVVEGVRYGVVVLTARNGLPAQVEHRVEVRATWIATVVGRVGPKQLVRELQLVDEGLFVLLEPLGFSYKHLLVVALLHIFDHLLVMDTESSLGLVKGIMDVDLCSRVARFSYLGRS